MVVRKSWVTKVEQGERKDAGFFDSSVFEAKQRESDDVLKRFLLEGLKNSTVTCVLVGAETTLRRWVRYEIMRSFVRNNGLLAIRIHSIAGFDKKTCASGSNPFNDLAFVVKPGFPIWLWYFCPFDQSSSLDFRGFLERNQATEGDTQWVNYKRSPFSSRSTDF